MRHEEFLSRISNFSDSAEDAASVLAHAGSCALCRKEERAAEKALARLDPGKRSPAEVLARWSAAAAVVALLVLGIQKEARAPGGPDPRGREARYVVVGDATGVIAHTPEGTVVGVSPQKLLREKEIVK